MVGVLDQLGERQSTVSNERIALKLKKPRAQTVAGRAQWTRGVYALWRLVLAARSVLLTGRFIEVECSAAARVTSYEACIVAAVAAVAAVASKQSAGVKLTEVDV